MNSNTLGYWWTTDSDYGWEGFAPSREDALVQIKACCYSPEVEEVELRPGYDSPDESDNSPIEFTGPSEYIQLSS